MGVVQNIGYDKFPKQGSFLGKQVEVCFNYDVTQKLRGLIVRDDTEEPGLLIIQLSDHRYVLATECQYCIL